MKSDEIKQVVLDNNWFGTPAGERFREMFGIKGISAVIAFAGRSKDRCSYQLSESDDVYVTHLYTDDNGQLHMQLASEDIDDYSLILNPSNEPVDDLDDEILEEWIKLLNYEY